MKKRQFLTMVAAAGALPLAARTVQAAARLAGPAVLTITGASVQPNRGKFDPVRDQMMHKHQVSFTRAHAFDHAALASLPRVAIKPTLEYDGKRRALAGPLLLDVLKQATGKTLPDSTNLLLRAVDGYVAGWTVARARALRLVAAIEVEGEPMALGGLGPVWAVYDADQVPEMANKPLADRFSGCPWGLYHIEIQS